MDAEKAKFSKVEETKVLIDYIETYNLWFQAIDDKKYIGEGGGQRIYESALGVVSLFVNQYFIFFRNLSYNL